MSETAAAPAPGVLEEPAIQQAIVTRERRGKHFLRAAVIGLIAGALGVLYALALFAAEKLRTGLLDALHGHAGWKWWAWAVLPAIGLIIGCFIGYTTRRFAPEASGSGIPHVKAVLVHVREMKWKWLMPIKFLNGILGAGIGLSLGREGPTVQLGAAAAKAVADLLKLKKRAVPGLVALGSGAGLAAAFNAPLAGFIFVLEELQREMSPLTYGGALVAAVSADVVARYFLGQLPSFSVTQNTALPLGALPLVVLLGVAAGVAGVAFNKSLVGATRAANSLKRVPGWMLPGISGVLVGVTAWWLPDAIGAGNGVAEEILRSTYGAGVLLMVLLFVVKFVMTVTSYASGAPGGIFAPMLLLGAVLGSLTGVAAEAMFPSLKGMSSAFAVLGMAAFFASSVRAPLTGIVLILEMTANYELLFALSVACLVSYLVADKLHDRPVYEALLEYDLHRGGTKKTSEEPVSVVVSIQRGSRLEGKVLRQAGLPKGSLVVGVERGGREMIPSADLALAPGDHITVLVPGEDVGMAMAVVDMARQL